MVRLPRFARVALLVSMVAGACAGALTTAAPGASTATTTVTATITSATQISTAACLGDQPGSTNLGALLPGASVVSTSDCSITFGSSNDASQLRMRLLDGLGTAMHATPTGALATGFGSGGRFTGGSGTTEELYDAEPGPNGSVYLAGEICCVWNGIIGRVTSAGAFDTAYAGDGTAELSILADTSFIDTVPTADGGIIGVGYSKTTGALPAYGTRFIAKYRANGTLDPTFSGDGIVTMELAETEITGFMSVAVDGHGRIYAGGLRNSDAIIERFDKLGNLDPTWGTAGRATLSWAAGAEFELVHRIVVLPDGTLTILGFTENGTADTARLMRLSSAGAAIGAFGTAGTVSLPTTGALTEYWANADLTVQPDGKPVVLLPRTDGSRVRWEIIRRVAATGAADTSWNTTGSLFVTTGGTGADTPGRLLQMGDGRMLATGSIATPTAGSIAVAGTRANDFNVDVLDAPALPNYGGSNLWGSANSLFGACLRTVGAGTSATWDTGLCTTTDASSWNPVPAAASIVATGATAVTTASANIRFGVRASTTQAAGTYIAPVTFDVLTP